MEGDVQANGLARVDDAVTVVCRAYGGAVINGITVQINRRLGQLGHCFMSISNGVRVIRLFKQSIVRIYSTCINNLRLNELGGIHFSVGIVGAEKCRDTGNSRCRHRSTVQAGILIAGPSGANTLANGINLILNGIVRIMVIVREGRNPATVLIGTHNANNIRKRRWVRHANVFALFTRQVVTSAIVTGSCNQNTGIISIFQCFFYGNRNEGATEGHIDNRCAVHIGILNCFGNVGVIEVTGGVTGLKHHDLAVIGNTDAADFIIFSGDDTGNMGTVTVIVHRILVIANTVPTVYIINIAVAVIVKTVVGNFCGVDPNIIAEVKVSIINARINNRHYNIAATAGVLAVLRPTVRNVGKAQIGLLIIIRVLGLFCRHTHNIVVIYFFKGI